MENLTAEHFCRVCLNSNRERKRMCSLFETVIDEQTPLAIIERCFGIEIPNAQSMDQICVNCKDDLEAAYRFMIRLRKANEQLGLMSTVPTVVEAELAIKTEQLQQIDCKPDIKEELTDTNDEQSEESHIIKSRKSTRKKPVVKPASPIKHDEDSNDSGDDGVYDPNESSDETDGEEKPQVKGRNYRVKPNSQPKRCCSCKEPLDSHEKAQEHSQIYHQAARVTNPKEYGDNVFECEVCFKRFETNKQYLQHQRKMYADVLHPCPRCKEEFANAFVLKKHIKYDHKKKFLTAELEELRSKSNMCCGCKKQFSTLEALREHVNQTHYQERKLCDTSNTFECDVCYNRFKTYKSLKHHQLRLFRENKFVCTACGKTFREKARLAEHEQNHIQVTKLQCPLCPTQLSNKSSYNVHVKMHNAEEAFNCEFCGKGFRKKSLLTGHLEIHNLDRPFKCSLCPITFTRQNLLDSHLLDHSGAKPHKCNQCPASYIYQRDLRRHIRDKHEGIKSFICTICSKAYNRNQLLIAHLKTHEKKDKFNL